MVNKRAQRLIPRWRYLLVIATLLSMPTVIVARIAQLQIMPNGEHGVNFLQNQGDARTVRNESIPAFRGLITDRNGEPLAVSTPVTSLILNPQRFYKLASAEDWTILAHALNMDATQLADKIGRYRNKSFMYLARQIPTVEAKQVLSLGIVGVEGLQEYKRFYPAGEVTAQLVGFTGVDDHGQEGLELAYNAWLTGESGSKKVIKDLAGRVIQDVSLIKPARPGETLRLSIDLRIQYTAYRALKAAVQKHHARSGSVIVLDVQTGEVLAMVNQPSFNPNDRSVLRPQSVRNRAVTDMIEPGSTIKPFTLLAALESGKFKPETLLDTNPGYVKVGYKTFVDARNYGILNLSGILAKSSQVGTTKLALQLDPYAIREIFERVGLGQDIGIGFPGETAGKLPNYNHWHPVTQATFSFGYGLSVSALQLARAYSILANDGVRKEVSLTVVDVIPEGISVIDAQWVRQIRSMLQLATSDQGTGKRAVVNGYSVGGKTGTLHKVKTGGGYHDDRYISAFAGFSPVENPRLVTVVIIDEPRDGNYFGGLVAAPIFAEVTGRTLRLLKVPPDQWAMSTKTLHPSMKHGTL